MRAYGVLTPLVAQVPDSVQTLLLAAGAAQAFDWPLGPGTFAGSASAANAQMVHFTAMTTAGIPMVAMVNLVSTNATVPTSGSSVTTGTSVGSTGNAVPITGGDRMFIVPGYSTGWSAAAQAPGYVIAEIWHR